MTRSGEDQSGSTITPLPVQALLDPVQAAAHLGLAPGLFRALRFFRCGPSRLMLRGKAFYRRVELDKLRQDWCMAVQVSPENRLAVRPAPDLRHRADSEEEPLDPLMRLLALRAIRHRIVVSIFWTMGIIGGAICLILY
ncbi:hypothetical protein ABHV46_08980 [Asaia sp. BMEF1]|uniref:hypothetical protein n=1 Tax=Asaia sp. BMEF1 TaxID=3155932 RepID=UPI003F66779A